MKHNREVRISILFVALLLLTSIFFMAAGIFSINGRAEGQGDYPPPDQGDWVITSDTLVQNEIITIQGNITIEEGGRLTLDNVALRINASNYGYAWINVKRGGELNIINNSEIMQGESGINYDFMFENGSKGKITNSTIKNCGWDDGDTWQSSDGILIMSDNVTIENSTIQSNNIGIVVFQASPVIKNNLILDNRKNGILIMTSSPQIIGNKIVNSPVGILAIYSNIIFIDDEIRDSGDGMRFFYSSIHMNDTKVLSNSRDDCTSGTCSPIETGKGIYIEFCNLSMNNSNISENNDDGLMAYHSDVHIQNSSFSSNLGNGITGDYSEIDLTNNIFSDNSLYGIEIRSTPLKLDESNTFVNNHGAGRAIMEWRVFVDVKDGYGEKVANAEIEFLSELVQYDAFTNLLGSANIIVAEYEIDNEGTIIDHNPYNVIVKKTGSWDDVEYVNTTTLLVRDNVETNLTLHLKKPDLKVEGITFSDTPRTDKKVKIKVKISNIGDALAKDVQIIVTETDSQGILHVVNTTTISINSTDEQELSFTWVPNQEGETVINAVITTGYDEIDKVNNELEKNVVVKGEEKPFYEDPYFAAVLVFLLFVFLGISGYILAFKKKKDEE